jgi:hypothetical protein
MHLPLSGPQHTSFHGFLVTSKKRLSCSLDHCPLLCQRSARDESIESERYHVTYNGDFNTFEVLGVKEPQVNPDINVIEVPGA